MKRFEFDHLLAGEYNPTTFLFGFGHIRIRFLG